MGHTAWSARIANDELISELKSFSRALRGVDKEYFESLMKGSFKHIGSISYVSSMHLWAFFLLSIMLEQEKKIKKQEELLRDLLGCDTDSKD